MPGISHNTPLSTQLADELRRRIAEGEYAVGALHPTEAELAAAEAAQSDGGEDPAEDDATEE